MWSQMNAKEGLFVPSQNYWCLFSFARDGPIANHPSFSLPSVLVLLLLVMISLCSPAGSLHICSVHLLEPDAVCGRL